MAYICVDFDGTLFDHRYPHIGPEVPWAFDYLKKFIAKGHKIILFTMRGDKELNDAVNAIKLKGIELYGVNTNPTQIAWTKSPKAHGDLYIDDAAVGCPLIKYPNFYRKCVDWERVGPLTEKILIDI